MAFFQKLCHSYPWVVFWNYSLAPFTPVELSCKSSHNPWTGVTLYLEVSSQGFIILDKFLIRYSRALPVVVFFLFSSQKD